MGEGLSLAIGADRSDHVMAIDTYADVRGKGVNTYNLVRMTMEPSLRTLGANEARVILSATAESLQVVTRRWVVEVLDGDRVKASHALHALLRKGWLVKLGAGRYAVIPPDRGPEIVGENNALAMASVAVEPAYVGWWSASAFHGLTTQRPALITVATTRQVAARRIEGTRVRFVKLAERKFFGGRIYDLYGRAVAVSDPAKTLVDCLDRPDLCGGHAELARIAFGAKAAVGPQELVETALKMGSVSLLQRAGFLLDLVGWEMPPVLRAAIRDRIPRTARSVFGRKEALAGDLGYVPDWGLIVHATMKELVSDTPELGRR